MAAEHGHAEAEGWRLRKDGSRFWAAVVLTALRTTDGDLVGFAKVTRDRSENKAYEDELARSNADLEVFAGMSATTCASRCSSSPLLPRSCASG